MKVINYFARVIVIIFFLLFLSLLLITLTYKEERNKVCRNNIDFDISNYMNIGNIQKIDEFEICDRVSLFITLNDNINEGNISGVILNIVNAKRIYNDDIILELYLNNNSYSFFVLIDENESFDYYFINN